MIELEQGFYHVSIGQLRVVRWYSDHKVRQNVIFIPPFGEEMNNARRTISLTAQALANNGMDVIIYDPPGMGETISHEDGTLFEEHVVAFGDLANQFMDGKALPLTVISIRQGFLTFVAGASSINSPTHHITWSPIVTGEEFLHGLLKQRVMADRFRNSKYQTHDELLQQLLEGQDLMIGGICLTSEFARGIVAHPKTQEKLELSSAHLVKIQQQDTSAVAHLSQYEIYEISADLPWQAGTTNIQPIVDVTLDISQQSLIT